MNYGLYLSASGVLTNSYRQDVFANNLANVETVGFKRDIPAIRQRDPEAMEKGLGTPGSFSGFRQQLLNKLGGGSLAGTQQISFAPAPLKAGGPLDVALEGRNAFFAVSTKDPQTGEKAVRLTRDGRFTRSAQGLLTTVAGDPVLDASDQPIQVPVAGPVEIDSAGRVRANGEAVGQIQVTAVSSTDRLTKQGNNLFAWGGKEDIRRPAKDAGIQPGMVETSGVDPTRAMMDLLDVTRQATANGNLIRYHDLLMDRAVNVLGRVA